MQKIPLTEKNTAFRSGFVAIAGAPNAGKSTLLNRILGEKISITSKKPQTTRNRILGVAHRPGSQMVFIDTPGVHQARGELNIRIVDVALTALGDVDLVLLVVDLTAPDPSSEKLLLKALKDLRRPATLALNKTDRVKKNTILPAIEAWSGRYPFREIIPVSAKHGSGIEELLAAMEKSLPEGPPFFPEDSLTDLPYRFLVAEVIREKAFRLTGQEIPYSVAVTIDTFKNDANKNLTKINATIHVERDSQKGIIIGKKGSKLRQIGENARKEIEQMLTTRVYLKLFVRVQKNWSQDTKALRRFGY
jgi:GTP-binding protein Era